LDVAVEQLGANGEITREGGDLVLDPARCAPGKREEAPVVGFAPEQISYWLYRYISSLGCRYPSSAAPELIAPDLAYGLQTAAEADGFSLGPEGRVILEAQFVEILRAADDPNGWVQIDPATGELIAKLCVP
jgi:hypothetical protein